MMDKLITTPQEEVFTYLKNQPHMPWGDRQWVRRMEQAYRNQGFLTESQIQLLKDVAARADTEADEFDDLFGVVA